MSQRTEKEKLLQDSPRGPVHHSMRGPSGPGPPRSGSSPEGFDDSVEGYDLKFDPGLDQKYECPICLLGLREPVQTECGHRFCNSCIKKSLRDTGERCPIDNTSLTESQLPYATYSGTSILHTLWDQKGYVNQEMFLDVCVKREIMDLRVHCPHPGCLKISELRHIEAHQAECEFLPIPCPNNCGAFCILTGIEEHLAKSCMKRRVACNFCETMVQFNRMSEHLDTCPKVGVKCPHCEEVFIQEQIISHVEKQCPNVEVPCTFVFLGCKLKVTRDLLEKHLNESIHMHMSLIANSLLQLQVSMTQSIAHQYRLMSNGSTQDFSTISNVPSDFTGARLPESLTSGLSSITSTMESLQIRQSDQQPLRGYQWQGTRSGVAEQSRQTLRDGRDSPEVLILKDRLKYQEQKTAVQEQKIFELHSKVLYGDQKLAEKDETIDLLRGQLRNIEARNCGGKFYWKLEKFFTLREEANLNGSDTVVRHSQGFYTSYYGYKLCVRVNLNCRDPSKGYVSLFIHFMKGEFDDYLEWPFQGNITLSIEDQNSDFVKRKHISEMLIAKPGLAAFDKPASNRNHKGFGYMDFAPLSSLENGSYIKDGAILIKVIVCPTSSK